MNRTTDNITAIEFLVTASKAAKTRNGSDYCTLRLKNRDQEIGINVWDTPADERPQVGELVVFSDTQNNEGKLSAKNNAMRRLGPCPQKHPLYNLLPHPIDRTTWDNCIAQLMSLANEDSLKPLIAEIAERVFPYYAKHPAATSVHHAFPGGLLNHTYQMLHMLEGLYPTLPYPVSIAQCTLAILFHDYGKLCEYKENGDPQPDMALLGHVFISANKIHKFLEDRHVDEATIKKVTHIVLAHHGQHEFGAPVLPCTQEAVLVNALDNLSAKMDALNNTPNGDPCYALGNARVVKQ